MGFIIDIAIGNSKADALLWQLGLRKACEEQD